MVKKVVKLSELSAEEKKHFREKYDHFIFDKDGTLSLWGRPEPTPGAQKAVSTLAARGKNLYVYTDNSMVSKEENLKAVLSHFPQFKKENIFFSADVVIAYLKKIGFNKKIYAVGEEDGVVSDLRKAGFQVSSEGFKMTFYNLEMLRSIELETDIGAVVVSYDPNFSFVKLLKAMNYVMDPRVLFLLIYKPLIGFKDKFIIPGDGCLTLPIEAVSKREPTDFCKGSRASTDFLRSLGPDIKRCLLIGDSLDTDILCGNRSGMDTLFVLTGKSKEEHLQAHLRRGDELYIPTYMAETLAELELIFS